MFESILDGHETSHTAQQSGVGTPARLDIEVVKIQYRVQQGWSQEACQTFHCHQSRE